MVTIVFSELLFNNSSNEVTKDNQENNIKDKEVSKSTNTNDPQNEFNKFLDSISNNKKLQDISIDGSSNLSQDITLYSNTKNLTDINEKMSQITSF